MLNSSFTLQCNERFQAVSPASQSRSMSQTWGHTAGRRRGTRWCQSCRWTWKAMVWAQCNGLFLHYFGKWKNYHLKNAWGDVEAVALVTDDNIGFISPVKLLISTGICFFAMFFNFKLSILYEPYKKISKQKVVGEFLRFQWSYNLNSFK